MKTIKIPQLQNIRHIIHLSDIHIHLSKRHTEYIDVFNNLYDNLRVQNLDKKTTIGVICGDIYHDKTSISGEGVDLFINLVENLSIILGGLFIICGNHDFPKTDSTRVDLLNPILTSLEKQLKNVKYLRYSDYYQVNNIVFGVSSLLGDGAGNYDILKSPDIQKKQIKIALYHGSVGGALYDNDNEIVDNTTPDVFAGYDYVMLGDIHKYQQNQYYTYCGSLIQQNHSEHLYNHGYVLWDLRDKSSKLVKIPNDYCFFTLTIKNNVLCLPHDYYYDGSFVETTEELFDLIKPKPRLRLRCENSDVGYVDEILSNVKHFLQEKYGNNYVLQDVSREYNIAPLVMQNVSEDTNNDEILTINQHTNLMSNYLKNIMKVNNVEHDAIMDKFAEDITFGRYEDNEVNMNWCLERLTFENMFSHKRKIDINFIDKQNKIIGIFGDNAVGKTSILESLIFTLYEKSSKCKNSKDITKGHPEYVMNDKSNQMNCSVIFRTDDDMEYHIERNYKRSPKSRKITKSELKFYRVTREGNIENLSECNTKPSINKKIEEYVGTYENFIKTSITLQNSILGNNFINASNTERNELLDSLLKIGMYEQLRKQLNKKINENKTIQNERQRVIDKKQKEINMIEISHMDNIEQELQEKTTIFDKLTKECIELELKLGQDICRPNELKSEIENNRNQIAQVLKTIDKLKITDHNFNYDVRSKYDYENDIFVKEKDEQLEQLNNERDILLRDYSGSDRLYNSKKHTKIKEQIACQENRLKTIGNPELHDLDDSIVQTYKEYNDTIEDIQLTENDIRNRIDNLKKRLSRVSEIRYDEKCDCCMNNEKINPKLSLESEYESLQNDLMVLIADRKNIEQNSDIIVNRYSEYMILANENVEIKKLIMQKSELELDLDKMIKENEILTDLEAQKIKDETLIEKCTQIDTKILELKHKRNIEYDEYMNEYEKHRKIDEINLKNIKEKEKLTGRLNKLKDLETELQLLKDSEQVYSEYKIKKELLDTLSTEIQTTKENYNKLSKQKIKIDILSEEISDLSDSLVIDKTEETLNRLYLRSLEDLPEYIRNEKKVEMISECNKLISNFVSFRVITTPDDGLTTHNISSNMQVPIGLRSGFETFILSLGLRLGLLKISMLGRLNMMIVDEGFSCSDGINILKYGESFRTILSMLGPKGIFLLITHEEKLKESVDDFIELTE